MKFVLSLCLVVAFGSSSHTEAQTGQRDVSYGSQGVAVFGYDLASRTIQTSRISLVLSDGGLLFVTNSNNELTVCKLDANGVVDSTFGQNGVYTLDASIWASEGSQVAELADGKLVVGGNLYDGTGRYLITRLNVDGTTDTTFGEGGRVIYPGRYHVNLKDGRMIIVQPEGVVRMTRLQANGLVDLTFGINGTQTLSHQGVYDNSYQTPKSWVTSDGFVLLRLVTRHPGPGQTYKQTLLRLQSDGTPDTVFGASGALVQSVSSQSLPKVNDFISLLNGIILIQSSEGFVERFSATGIPGGSSDPVRVNSIEGIDSTGHAVLGINEAGNLRTYHLLSPLTWITSPLSWSRASSLSSALTPLPTGGYVRRSFVSFHSADRLSKFRSDGTADTSFGEQGNLIPEWHPAADCLRIRLHTGVDDNLSLLFDQGKDIISHSAPEGYKMMQTGVRVFSSLSPTGTPINTHVLHERSGNFAANLAPDGSCLIVGNGRVERLAGDGHRSTVKTVGRFPSVKIASVAESSDGHLL